MRWMGVSIANGVRLVPLVVVTFGCMPSASDSENGATSSSTTGSIVPTELALRFEPVALEAEPNGFTDFVFLPDGHEFLVLSKSGRVTHYELSGTNQAARLGGWDVPGVHTETDCGAISLEIDNDFARNRLLYVAKCTSRQFSGVYRYVFDTANYAAIAASEALIIEAGDPAAEQAWHNVGSLNMDRDGNLWVPFGEKLLKEHAQDRTNNLGALLKIVPNRALDQQGYTPAPGNPFVGEAETSPDIYAYGVRSPWRAILDQRGRLWFGDVGSNQAEEINLVSAPGQNFGWPNAEGNCLDDCSSLTDPVVFWNRDNDHDYLVDDALALPAQARVALVGIAYDSGTEDRYAGLLSDKLIFSDACVGFVRALEFTDHLISDVPIGHLPAIVAMQQAADGYIYALTFGRCLTDETGVLESDGAMLRTVLDY